MTTFCQRVDKRFPVLLVGSAQQMSLDRHFVLLHLEGCARGVVSKRRL